MVDETLENLLKMKDIGDTDIILQTEKRYPNNRHVLGQVNQKYTCSVKKKKAGQVSLITPCLDKNSKGLRYFEEPLPKVI